MNPMVLESDYDHPVKFYPSPNRAPATQCPFLSAAGLCTRLHFYYLRLQMLRFPRSKRPKQSKSRLSIETTRDVPKGIDQLSLNSFSVSVKSISYNTK